jgi:ATP-binding cassette subfamily B protein
LVDGLPLDEQRLRSLRTVTTWIDPTIQLWNDTLGANLEYAVRGVRRRPLQEVLEAADLLSVLGATDQGLETPLGAEGSLVSGGEGQRVRVGRGLFRADTRLAILDEPFRGLDRKTRNKLVLNSRLTLKNATMFFVSHDISMTLGFDRVLVVEEGKIIEDGHPAELAATDTRFRAMLESERRLRDEVWEPLKWRRLQVANGGVREV